MTENLILGEFTLISKQGIETRTEVHEPTNFFRDPERMAGDRYLASFDSDSTLDDMELIEPAPVHRMIPLDIPVHSEYISGHFQDAGFARADYEVTAWLLIEEAPEMIEG